MGAVRSRAPWYVREPANLAEVTGPELVYQPRMRLLEPKGRVVLSGPFEIREDDRVLDSFEIEIEPDPESPRAPPIVRETAGRIPWEADRHVFPDTGIACVVLADGFWFEYPSGLELVDFMKTPLRSYLAAQALVEQGEGWPHGEWGHGLSGVVEFYGEVLGVSDVAPIIDLLRVLASGKPRGGWRCPCGSGRRIRACHHEVLLQLHDRVPQRLREARWMQIRGMLR